MIEGRTFTGPLSAFSYLDPISPSRIYLSWSRMASKSLQRISPITASASACACRITSISLRDKPVVDWFEIISENFMIDGGRPLQILDQILEQYKVVQHGVSMYFGSAEKANREHLRRLKELVKRTKTPWLSDHLCWGSVDGRYTHDLLPMPYTFEAAKLTAQKVREVRDYLEVPDRRGKRQQLRRISRFRND